MQGLQDELARGGQRHQAGVHAGLGRISWRQLGRPASESGFRRIIVTFAEESSARAAINLVNRTWRCPSPTYDIEGRPRIVAVKWYTKDDA